MSTMHLVAYTSRWAGGSLPDDVQAIAAIAQARNPAVSVTGVLLCDPTEAGARFVQVLEGPEERVHALLARIVHDHRHTDVRMLLDTATPRRAFPDWSMEVRTLPSTTDAGALEALRKAYVAHFEPDAADFVVMVRALLDG